MGNKKNRRNREFSKHRHVFIKRMLPGARQRQKAPKEIKQKHTDTERGIDKEDILAIEGSRIINLEKLQEYTDSLTKHSSTCQGTIILSGESRDGLASILTGQCTACSHTIKLQTSKKVKGPRGYRRFVMYALLVALA